MVIATSSRAFVRGNRMWRTNCQLLMMLLSTMVPTVTALTVPSLRAYSSACPVLPARLIQMAAASPDSDEPRTIEVCEVTDDGLISECEVREFDKLSSEFGAHHFSSDPEADDELFFEMTTNDDERVHLTLDDWQKLCETEVVPEVLPEVTEDALQKALGPEHVSVSADESRLHLHFGAGRLGLGLVLPAVSASGVPFAAVQRPNARWMALFCQSSGVSCTLSSSFVVISEELVFRLRVAEKIMRPEL